jgi:hypothetical protein
VGKITAGTPRGVALRVELFSNQPMVAEREIAGEDGIDGTQGDGPKEFVREFAGKAYLLFLYHDLGCLFHEDPGQKLFNGAADDIGRLIARMIKKTASPQYRPIFRKHFFNAVTAGFKNRAEITDVPFLVAVRSDGNEGECLITERRAAEHIWDWFAEADSKFLSWVTVGNLVGADGTNLSDISGAFDTTEPSRVLIKHRKNRQMLRLFSGAQLRGSDGIIGTLERIPLSRIGNGYDRDHVISSSKDDGDQNDYRRGEALVTEVETRVLLRLATVFGFSCNCDEFAPLSIWDSAMKSDGEPMRQAAWQAFAGDAQAVAGGREMRGRSLADFSEAYLKLLKTAIAEGGRILYTGRQIERTTKARQKHPDNKASQDQLPQLLIDYPGATPDDLDYHLIMKGMKVLLQMRVSWSVGNHYYAFGDLRLKLNFTGVQKEFRIAEDSWPRSPATMVNEGIVTFDHPGFPAHYDLRMKLSKVTGLSTYPVFPGDGIPLFRFEQAEEDARFEAELLVRAGSLECVEGTQDDSAKAALERAVAQFLMTYGKENDNDKSFVPVARKGWTIWRGASDSNK